MSGHTSPDLKRMTLMSLFSRIIVHRVVQFVSKFAETASSRPISTGKEISASAMGETIGALWGREMQLGVVVIMPVSSHAKPQGYLMHVWGHIFCRLAPRRLGHMILCVGSTQSIPKRLASEG